MWKNDTLGGIMPTLTLADLQAVTRTLLACGATIHELNCVRKHLSQIKGGQLAQWLYPATSINLILSDVVGDQLETIASGMTVPDESTFEEALQILQYYDVLDQLPPTVISVLREGAAGHLPETPTADNPIFKATHNLLLGSNHQSVVAAAEQAKQLGYHTLILSSQITGEAREVAKMFVGIAREIQQHDHPIPKPACVIAGGETTVTLRGHGKGGRNQELALSFVNELRQTPHGNDGIYFLSAATDGIDGLTDAAGAFAAQPVLEKSLALNLNPSHYLRNNDSYRFFQQTGFLLKTGATHTNVGDLHILIVN